MRNRGKTNAELLALQTRIQELELENGRLSEELKQRKSLEYALWKSKAEYHYLELFEHSDQPWGIGFSDGRLGHVNSAFERLVGYSKKELESIDWTETLTPPEWRRVEQEKLEELLKTDVPVRYEKEYIRKDGLRVPVEMFVHLVRDDEGQLQHYYSFVTDITLRKQMEEALRQSEERFRFALQGSPIVVFSQDNDLRYTWAYNPSPGFKVEDVVGKRDEDIYQPEDVRTFTSIKRQVLATGIGRRDEVITHRPDSTGGDLIHDMTTQPLCDSKGAIIGVICSAMNITERKQVEEALKESQSMLAETQRIAGIGSWLWNIATGELRWSDELYDMYEVDPSTFTPSISSFNDYIHPDDRLVVLQKIEQIIATGTPIDFEFRIVSRTGKERILRTVGQVIKFDSSGNPLIMVGANQDITEQKRVEQALRESEEHLRVAIKNSPMVVYTADRDLRYTWIYNPPFGMEPEQILGKTDEELNDPANVAQLTAFKRSVLETGIGKRQEIEWHYQDGVYCYDVTAEPVRDEEGQITGLTVAVIDITQKKQLEKAAQENQVRIKLQRYLIEQRERERLAIAQEIHDGPTQTVAGTLLELHMAREFVNDPALKAELERIELHMKSAVQELREIISGLRPLLLRRFGFSEAIRRHASDFCERHHTIDITYAIAEDEGKLSKDICVSLFRIYQEALKNIAQHAGASRANVQFSFEGEVAVLEIEDDGKGIDSVTDPLLLIDQGHYGLAGMKERVEAVDGEFQLRTGSNQGTTITVKVPINRKQS